MLKTNWNNEVWCVSQPDHAAVAGYLAAHWGNREFKAPGYFAESMNGERLQAEVAFGIAQHDNGWWEWESTPEFDRDDGLPLDLTAVLNDQHEGMERWRRGIPRFADSHPYASLLTSWHAYWLYAPSCDEDENDAFIHPLFLQGKVQLVGERLNNAKSFVEEMRAIQHELTTAITDDPTTTHWVDPAHLSPHVRMLQILDGLSLWMCSGLVADANGEPGGPGQNAVTFVDVPALSWDNRVELKVEPMDERRIAIAPYPFDIDELTVSLPVKIVSTSNLQPSNPQLSWWMHRPQLIDFVFCRQSDRATH